MVTQIFTTPLITLFHDGMSRFSSQTVLRRSELFAGMQVVQVFTASQQIFGEYTRDLN
jgi:hypothetical protein